MVIACAFAGVEIGCRDVHNAVGIDGECDLDLRHAARRSSDPGELESTELLVLPRHRALALQNVDIDRGLEARRGCEDLTFADGKGRVALNDPCADTAEVSMPRDSGVTSSSSSPFTLPDRTPACRHAPMATHSSGLMPLKGAVPVIWLTSS